MRGARALGLVPLVPVLLILAVPLLAAGQSQGPSGGVPTHPDIPPIAMTAYVSAADQVGARDPACRPSWALLAGIGKVETDHGRFGGSALDGAGVAVPPILGVRLDGSLPGTRVIVDTDDGALDGDPAVDRAVGPMQFIPSTWARWAEDGDGDGRADPQNLFDAATAAAAYLCGSATGDGATGDIATPEGARGALLAYNRSTAYGDQVLEWMATYLAEAEIGGDLVGSGPIACPVAGPVQFIDSWHFPRSGGRVHLGQDLFAAEGTPLVALADAVVTDARTGAGLGGTVVWLATADGQHWYYAHLQRMAPGLHVGQQLRRGDPVGTVGRTGNAAATPAHLHIQWRPTARHGADTNPYPLLSAACPGHDGPG